MSDDRATSWFCSPGLWEGLQVALFGAAQVEQAGAQVDDILALADAVEPRDVLDLPCGTGRFSIELARRGQRVTAVDLTKAYVEHGRRRAAEEDLAIDWAVADMHDFRRPAAFDLALNLWSSFGYSPDPADDRRVLANFHASLRPGGTLVMDLACKELLAPVFRPRDWTALDDGRVLLQERDVEDDWSATRLRYTILDARDSSERGGAPLRAPERFELWLRLYDAAGLKALLLDVGFGDVRCFGGLDGRDFGPGASRLWITARR